MGVESVPVAEALSHADILKIACRPLIIVYCGKRYATDMLKICKRYAKDMQKICYGYRSDSTNICKENHRSEALKLLGKTAQTQMILSPETT